MTEVTPTYSPFMKVLRAVGSVLFLVFSVAVYLAFYQALQVQFGEYINNMWIIMVLCFTYMFRIDILAGSFAFLGLWKVHHLPEWMAMVICSAFVMISIFVNHGAATRMKYFFGRINKPEMPIDAARAERVARDDR